jgi:competence protein CoiA
MLSAVDNDGTYVLALDVQRRDQGPFFCPECKQEVIFRAGPIKTWHFAHWPDADTCTYGGGESEEHQLAKIELYQALKAVPGVEKVQVERHLGEVRPDVSFVYQGQYFALEIQISSISRELIEWRTQMYTQKNIAVLWMVPFYEELDEEWYAPLDYERYLHGFYFGKVYYWDEGLQLQPIKFGEYLLAPGRHTNARRSVRYVTPIKFDPVSVLDLTSVWRQPFQTRLGSFPRAKLWCERWRPQREQVE